MAIPRSFYLTARYTSLLHRTVIPFCLITTLCTRGSAGRVPWTSDWNHPRSLAMDLGYGWYCINFYLLSIGYWSIWAEYEK